MGHDNNVSSLGLSELSVLLGDCNPPGRRAAAYRRVRELTEKSGNLPRDGLSKAISAAAITAETGDKLWAGRAIKTLCGMVSSPRAHLIPASERLRLTEVFGNTVKNSDFDIASASAVGLSAPALRHAMTDVPSSELFKSIIQAVTVPVSDLHSDKHARVCVRALAQIIKSKVSTNCVRRLAGTEQVWVPWLVEVISRFGEGVEPLYKESMGLLWSTVLQYTPFVSGHRPLPCEALTNKMQPYEALMVSELPTSSQPRFHLSIWSIIARYSSEILSPELSQKMINKLLSTMSSYLSKAEPSALADGLICLTQLLGSWTAYTRKTRISNIVTMPVVKERSRVWNQTKNSPESCAAGLYVWQQLLEQGLYPSQSHDVNGVDDFMNQVVTDYMSMFYSSESGDFLQPEAIYHSAYYFIATVIPSGSPLAKSLSAVAVFQTNLPTHISVVDGYERPPIPQSVLSFVFEISKGLLQKLLSDKGNLNCQKESLLLITLFLGACLLTTVDPQPASVADDVIKLLMLFCKDSDKASSGRSLSTFLSLQCPALTSSLCSIDTDNLSGAPGLTRPKVLLLNSYRNNCSRPCSEFLMFEKCLGFLQTGKPSNRLQNLVWLCKVIVNEEWGHDDCCKCTFELETLTSLANLLSTHGVVDEDCRHIVTSILSKVRNWDPLLVAILSAASRPYVNRVTDKLMQVVKRLLSHLNGYYQEIQRDHPTSPVVETATLSAWHCNNCPATAVIQLLTWDKGLFFSASNNQLVIPTLIEWVMQQSTGVKPNFIIPDAEETVLRARSRHNPIFTMFSNPSYTSKIAAPALTNIIVTLISHNNEPNHLIKLFNTLQLLLKWCLGVNIAATSSEGEVRFFLTMHVIHLSTDVLFEHLRDSKINKKTELYDCLQQLVVYVVTLLTSKQVPLSRWVVGNGLSAPPERPNHSTDGLLANVTDCTTPLGKVQLSVNLLSGFLSKILTFHSTFILEKGVQLWESTFGNLSKNSSVVRLPEQLASSLQSTRKAGISLKFPDTVQNEKVTDVNIINVNEIAETQDRQFTPPEPTALGGRLSKSRFLTPQRKPVREATINLPLRQSSSSSLTKSTLSSKKVSFSNKDTPSSLLTSLKSPVEVTSVEGDPSQNEVKQVDENNPPKQNDPPPPNQKKEVEPIPAVRKVVDTTMVQLSPYCRKSLGGASESTVETPEVREGSVLNGNADDDTTPVVNPKICRATIDPVRQQPDSNPCGEEAEHNDDTNDSPLSVQIVAAAVPGSLPPPPTRLNSQLAGTSQFEVYFTDDTDSEYPNEPSQDITSTTTPARTTLIKDVAVKESCSDQPLLIGSTQFEDEPSYSELPDQSTKVVQSSDSKSVNEEEAVAATTSSIPKSADDKPSPSPSKEIKGTSQVIASQKTDKSGGCSSSGPLPESPPAVKGKQLQLQPSGQPETVKLDGTGMDQFTIDTGGQTPLKKAPPAIDQLTIATEETPAPVEGGRTKINFDQLTIVTTTQAKNVAEGTTEPEPQSKANENPKDSLALDIVTNPTSDQVTTSEEDSTVVAVELKNKRKQQLEPTCELKRQKSEKQPSQPSPNQKIKSILDNLSDEDASLVILSDSLAASQFQHRKVSPLFTSAPLDMNTVMVPIDDTSPNQPLNADDSSELATVKQHPPPEDSSDAVATLTDVISPSEVKNGAAADIATLENESRIAERASQSGHLSTPPRQVIVKNPHHKLLHKKPSSPEKEKAPANAMKLRRRELLLKRSEPFINSLKDNQTPVETIISSRDWIGGGAPCTIRTVGDLCSLQPTEVRQYLQAPEAVRDLLLSTLADNANPQRTKSKRDTASSDEDPSPNKSMSWDNKVSSLVKRFKADLEEVVTAATSSDDRVSLCTTLCRVAEEVLCSEVPSPSSKGVLRLSDSQEV